MTLRETFESHTVLYGFKINLHFCVIDRKYDAENVKWIMKCNNSDRYLDRLYQGNAISTWMSLFPTMYSSSIASRTTDEYNWMLYVKMHLLVRFNIPRSRHM